MLVAPVLRQLQEAGVALTVYTKDDAAFPRAVARSTNADLSISYHHEIETVPTLIKVEHGAEVDRTSGWSRPAWEDLAGVPGLGVDLPERRSPAAAPGR